MFHPRFIWRLILICLAHFFVEATSFAQDRQEHPGKSDDSLAYMLGAHIDFSWLFDPTQLDHIAVSPSERRDARQVEALARVAESQGIAQRADVRAARQAADQLVLAEAARRSLVNSIQPTDADIAKWIAAHPGRYDEYRLRHIFVAIGPTRGGATRPEREALALANRLRARIGGGERFEKVAELASEDASTAAEGGALSDLLGVTMDEAFYSYVKDLPVGAITQPVRGPEGFHLIKLEARQPATVASARYWVEQDMIKERLPGLIANAIAQENAKVADRR